MTNGLVGALRELYEKSAAIAVTSDFACREGGREQIVLTAAAYELKSRYPDQVCLLLNDPRQQSAAVNMGVNNNLQGTVLNSATGKVEAQRGGTIALVHQFDRRPAVAAFIEKHVVKAGKQ